MAFAFDTETTRDGFVLTSFNEKRDEEVFKADEVMATPLNLRETKMKTASMIEEAEQNMMDLSSLIRKSRSGSATYSEIERMKSLHKKLDRAKEEISESRTIEKDMETRILHSKTREKVREIESEIKKKDIRAAIRAVCRAESVDLCFIIDSTGSMGSYIVEAKNSIQQIVRGIRSTNDKLNLRLAVVGYRDLCDGDKRIESLDFTRDASVFENFLSGLQPFGGGDGPEDMAGGIQKANTLSWSQATRVVFLIADCPCHCTHINGMSGGDDYPSGTPGIDIVKELKTLTSRVEQGSTTVTFGRITNQTDLMVLNLQKLGINMDVVELNDAKRLTSIVTKSVRRSVFKTMTVASGAGKSVAFTPIADMSSLLRKGKLHSTRSAITLKKYEIVHEFPSSNEWLELDIVHVKVFRNMQVQKISDLQEPIHIGILKCVPGFFEETHRTEKTKKSSMYMRRSTSPFAEGEIRLAYHAQLARKQGDLSSNHVVMKAYKHLGKGVNSREQYFKQMEVSTIACYLAKKYNEVKAPSHCAKIKFLPVVVVEEEDASMEEIGSRRFCAEPPLPTDGTKFAKYSNNCGHWDEEIIDESLLLFTKFTHEITGEYLLIADLQGVKKDDTYYLTDPVILCKDILRFGNTNLGEIFMQKCIDATSAYLKEYGWYH